jgi:hypothetical protein
LSRTGVIIPNSAIVVFAGQSWCFIETSPKKFERRAVALDLPIADGFLVNSGFSAGQRVVVRGASLLLSREAGPSEDDDDEGNAKKSTEPAIDRKPATPSGDDKNKNAPVASSEGNNNKHDDDDGEKSTHTSVKHGTKAAASSGKDPD